MKRANATPAPELPTRRSSWIFDFTFHVDHVSRSISEPRVHVGAMDGRVAAGRPAGSHLQKRGVVHVADENGCRAMPGGCTCAWQRRQRFGSLSTSIFRLMEPCGLWQTVQPSRMASCSKTNGRVCSRWHCAQLSFCRAMASPPFGLKMSPPCGSWHCTQLMCPSMTG